MPSSFSGLRPSKEPSSGFPILPVCGQTSPQRSRARLGVLDMNDCLHSVNSGPEALRWLVSIIAPEGLPGLDRTLLSPYNKKCLFNELRFSSSKNGGTPPKSVVPQVLHSALSAKG